MRIGYWPAMLAALASPVLSNADDLALKEGAIVQIGGHRVTVAKYDVLPYRETIFSKLCVYDRYDNPKLTELRDEYKLNKVVAAGRTEFEKQVLLLHWAYSCFDFGDPKREIAPGRFQDLGSLRNALIILALARKEQKFFCVQYASVLISAAASMGWVCRLLGSGTDTWTEMWSNQYGRWVHFNPTVDHYWEKGGIPIDTCSAQAALKAGAKDLTLVAHDGRTYPLRLVYDKYNYITNTNWMDMEGGYGRTYTISVADNRGGLNRNNLTQTDAASDVLFPINQAALGFTPQDRGFAVSIKTMTPNFKTFMVRIDGKEWKESGDSFAWNLHADRNVLEVKSVNEFGVDGYVSTVVLEVITP